MSQSDGLFTLVSGTQKSQSVGLLTFVCGTQKSQSVGLLTLFRGTQKSRSVGLLTFIPWDSEVPECWIAHTLPWDSEVPKCGIVHHSPIMTPMGLRSPKVLDCSALYIPSTQALTKPAFGALFSKKVLQMRVLLMLLMLSIHTSNKMCLKRGFC